MFKQVINKCFCKSKVELIPVVLIDNHQVEQLDCVKSLGVSFDQIEKKNIYKASSVLDTKSLKIFYFPLFYPDINYCCEV